MQLRKTAAGDRPARMECVTLPRKPAAMSEQCEEGIWSLPAFFSPGEEGERVRESKVVFCKLHRIHSTSLEEEVSRVMHVKEEETVVNSFETGPGSRLDCLPTTGVSTVLSEWVAWAY